MNLQAMIDLVERAGIALPPNWNLKVLRDLNREILSDSRDQQEFLDRSHQESTAPGGPETEEPDAVTPEQPKTLSLSDRKASAEVRDQITDKPQTQDQEVQHLPSDLTLPITATALLQPMLDALELRWSKKQRKFKKGTAYTHTLIEGPNRLSRSIAHLPPSIAQHPAGPVLVEFMSLQFCGFEPNETLYLLSEGRDALHWDLRDVIANQWWRGAKLIGRFIPWLDLSDPKNEVDERIAIFRNRFGLNPPENYKVEVKPEDLTRIQKCLSYYNEFDSPSARVSMLTLAGLSEFVPNLIPGQPWVVAGELLCRMNAASVSDKPNPIGKLLHRMCIPDDAPLCARKLRDELTLTYPFLCEPRDA